MIDTTATMIFFAHALYVSAFICDSFHYFYSCLLIIDCFLILNQLCSTHICCLCCCLQARQEVFPVIEDFLVRCDGLEVDSRSQVSLCIWSNIKVFSTIPFFHSTRFRLLITFGGHTQFIKPKTKLSTQKSSKEAENQLFRQWCAQLVMVVCMYITIPQIMQWCSCQGSKPVRQ